MRLDLELRLCVGVHRVPVLVLVKVDGLHDELAPAWLVALAAARALAEDVVAHEAAARLRHALRPVYEALYFRRATQLLHNLGDFAERAFAREDYARRPLRGKEAHSLRIRRRHLRGYVESRAVLFAERYDAPVGDDERIDVWLRLGNRTLDIVDLALEHYRI